MKEFISSSVVMAGAKGKGREADDADGDGDLSTFNGTAMTGDSMEGESTAFSTFATTSL
jgi:hypothetical protein